MHAQKRFRSASQSCRGRSCKCTGAAPGIVDVFRLAHARGLSRPLGASRPQHEEWDIKWNCVRASHRGLTAASTRGVAKHVGCGAGRVDGQPGDGHHEGGHREGGQVDAARDEAAGGRWGDSADRGRGGGRGRLGPRDGVAQGGPEHDGRRASPAARPPGRGRGAQAHDGAVQDAVVERQRVVPAPGRRGAAQRRQERLRVGQRRAGVHEGPGRVRQGKWGAACIKGGGPTLSWVPSGASRARRSTAVGGTRSPGTWRPWRSTTTACALPGTRGRERSCGGAEGCRRGYRRNTCLGAGHSQLG